MEYTKIINEFGVEIIIRTNDNGSVSSIPTDPANSDYQAYLNKDNPESEHFTPILPE